MKKLVFLIGIVVFFTTAEGQYVTDALKYSQNFPAITARSLSMGGAFASLGGDFSSVWINPAGLGLYRKSEFVVTPSLSYSSTKADYLGETNDDFMYQFNLGSLGYVANFNSGKDKGLVSAALAIGYVRENSFNNNILIRGLNPDNSLSDYFQQNAEGTDPRFLDSFYERLAFDSYIIDTLAESDFGYLPAVPLPADQRRRIDTRGGKGEWTIAYGLNFNNVFYFGAGLGVHTLQLDRTSVHSEFNTNPADDFSLFDFTEDLSVDGSGFSLNAGMMVRIAKIMRIGTSVHTPTYYRIRENYYNTLYSEFKNGDNYFAVPTDEDGEELGSGNYRYKLRTPFRAQGGLSVQIGQMGIVSADLEYVDYENMRLKEVDNNQAIDLWNSDIKTVYKSVFNLKLGGEVRFDNLSLRIGGGYYPSPVTYSGPDLYDYISNVPDSYKEVTAGIGYRNNNFFFDLGFSGLFNKEDYNLYTNLDVNDNFIDNATNLTHGKYRFLATLGFRF